MGGSTNPAQADRQVQVHDRDRGPKHLRHLRHLKLLLSLQSYSAQKADTMTVSEAPVAWCHDLDRGGVDGRGGWEGGEAVSTDRLLLWRSIYFVP